MWNGVPTQQLLWAPLDQKGQRPNHIQLAAKAGFYAQSVQSLQEVTAEEASW